MLMMKKKIFQRLLVFCLLCVGGFAEAVDNPMPCEDLAVSIAGDPVAEHAVYINNVHLGTVRPQLYPQYTPDLSRWPGQNDIKRVYWSFGDTVLASKVPEGNVYNSVLPIKTIVSMEGIGIFNVGHSYALDDDCNPEVYADGGIIEIREEFEYNLEETIVNPNAKRMYMQSLQPTLDNAYSATLTLSGSTARTREESTEVSITETTLSETTTTASLTISGGYKGVDLEAALTNTRVDRNVLEAQMVARSGFAIEDKVGHAQSITQTWQLEGGATYEVYLVHGNREFRFSVIENVDWSPRDGIWDGVVATGTARQMVQDKLLSYDLVKTTGNP